MTIATQSKPNLSLNKAFQNKFKLYIPRIGVIGSLFDAKSINCLEMNVKGTIVPGLSIGSVDVPVLAHKPLKVTGADYKMDDITVTFIVDGGFINYYMFWSWLNAIYNIKTATAPVLDNGDKPYVDIMISLLDNYNNDVVRFTYYGAFITGLSSIEVDYENTERIEATATFSYDDFDITPATTA